MLLSERFACSRGNTAHVPASMKNIFLTLTAVALIAPVTRAEEKADAAKADITVTITGNDQMKYDKAERKKKRATSHVKGSVPLGAYLGTNSHVCSVALTLVTTNVMFVL